MQILSEKLFASEDVITDFVIDREILLGKISEISEANDLADLRSRVITTSEFLRDYISSETGIHKAYPPENPINIKADTLFDNLNQILNTQTRERAIYYLDRLVKAYTEEKTSRYSDINLNRWKEYPDILTDSLWVMDKRDSSGVHTAGYWGNFIPQIPYLLITRYTKKGDWILDTFAGCGTSLIEAQRLGRNSIGFELQTDIVNRARNNILAEPNQHSVVSRVVEGDSTSIDYREALDKAGTESVQLVIMHPPYFDIIKFSKDERDLSNTGNIKLFLDKLEVITERAERVLDKGRFLTLVIGDKYEGGEWIPLGFLSMERIRNNGFTLKSIIVKNFEETTGKRNQKELWRYRALVGGFYIFKHEYIFVFQKD